MEFKRVAIGNEICIISLKVKKDNRTLSFNGSFEIKLIKNLIINQNTCITIMEADKVNCDNTTTNLMEACAFGDEPFLMMENDRNVNIKLDASMKIVEPSIRISMDPEGFRTK